MAVKCRLRRRRGSCRRMAFTVPNCLRHSTDLSSFWPCRQTADVTVSSISVTLWQWHWSSVSDSSMKQLRLSLIFWHNFGIASSHSSNYGNYCCIVSKCKPYNNLQEGSLNNNWEFEQCQLFLFCDKWFDICCQILCTKPKQVCIPILF